jgi:hypothetical protein
VLAGVSAAIEKMAMTGHSLCDANRRPDIDATTRDMADGVDA